jgi:hypothetical protein
VLTSNLPFTQWACAFADDQTLTAAMLDGCCIMPTSSKSVAKVIACATSAKPVR